MKHSIPPSPFATALSGSAKEAELRIRSIFQWKKQRPPVWMMLLVALTILGCFHLVSCQPMDPPPPEVSAEPLFIQPHGDGEFYIMEELPGEDQEPVSDTVAVLYYRSPTFGETRLAALNYGPGHHYWDSVSLEPFTGVLGYDGVIFRHTEGTAWNSVDHYALSDYGPFLLAPCYNKVWQEDLDGDGQLELLSNYHTMGYLDVYQRMGNGLITCTQLNSTAWRVLHDVSPDTWVVLSQGEQERTLTAEWRDENGQEYRHSLEGRSVLMAAGVNTVDVQDPDTGDILGTFYWQTGEDPYSLTAHWWPNGGESQELFSLSYPAAPSIAMGETEYTPLPQVALGAFNGILGQDGVLFIYDKGGRAVHHFFYVDENDQAQPLALCDPSWTSKDLDGDGMDELWSISENGQFFYFYQIAPDGQPRFAFVCGAGGNAHEALADFHRVYQTHDGGFVFYDQRGEQVAMMDGPALLAYIKEHHAWSDTTPSWSDGGRVGILD